MKKSLLLFGLTILLSGCTDNIDSKKDSSSSSKNEKITISTNTTEVSSTSSFDEISKESSEKNSDDKYVEEGKLTEIGQWTYDQSTGGRIELININDSKQEIFLIDGFKVVINDVKLFDVTNASPEYLDEFDMSEAFRNGNSYETIQIDYSVFNNTDKEINFRGFQYVSTDQRQQINVPHENILGVSNEYSFQPQTDTLTNGLIFFLNTGTVKNIKSVSLKTYDVSDSEFNILAEPVTFEVKFN